MFEFATAMLIMQVYDPAFWIAFALGAVFGKSRSSLLVGALLVGFVSAFGWWTVVKYQLDMGSGWPPLWLLALYVGGKFFGFALGVAFNRLIRRIEKRLHGVLEKART